MCSISIHVLREEDDALKCSSISTITNFNPRPPRGGRRDAGGYAAGDAGISIHVLREEDDGLLVAFGGFPLGFQSTSSARRTTYGSRRGYRHKVISIHVLREEDDIPPTSIDTVPKDFNPRPPRGGRRMTARRHPMPNLFQSTSSARRTTRPAAAGSLSARISIHVLREEDDLFASPGGKSVIKFQSTSSARRTTTAAQGW